jgi:hypothetical protein
MDRKMELDHLAIGQRAISNGERHIQREEQAIADLDRAGHDTSLARDMLATFRRVQAEHVAHRNLILKMLQQDAAKPRVATGPIFRPGHYDPEPAQEASRLPLESPTSIS